jgi:hypothetical protein
VKKSIDLTASPDKADFQAEMDWGGNGSCKCGGKIEWGGILRKTNGWGLSESQIEGLPQFA